MLEKKTSKASLIVAIVMLVASVVLIISGIAINSPRVVRESFGGYRSFMISYCSSNCQMGYLLVHLGGFMLLGGILLLILTAVISSGEVSEEKKTEEKQEEPKANPEDDPRYY